MITKNEEAWIAESLAHLRCLDPEVIVVDTGSSDATMRIARQMGARVFETAWEDDFSKPRNLSLQFATRPWILSIDPDERIAERDLQRLKALMLEKSHVKAFAFQTRNYLRGKFSGTSYPCDGSYPEEKDYPCYFLSCKIRLFQNQLGIRFRGVVHETVSDSVIAVCKPGEFEESDIPIHHYGALPELRTQKNKQVLYKKLTEKKVELEPQNPEAFVEFAKECWAANERERALAAFRRAHELDPSSPYYKHELMQASARMGML
jgi:glycosyltransferase involved in cell wall biosynthesis